MISPLPPEYRETVFHLEAPLSALPATFAIVTAWHPRGKTADGASNLAADELLRTELEAYRFPHFRATGASPDGRHREPGWAIECSFDQALELARHFDQLAMWWIEADDLQLVACNDGHRESLGSFRSRQAASMVPSRQEIPPAAQSIPR